MEKEWKIDMEVLEQIPSVRGMALDSLLDIMEKGFFCDKVMKKTLEKSKWEKRDRSLYKRLVSGTVERALTLDYILDQFSKVCVKKMKPVIRNILRMSLYQFFYMEKIPASAICNEAVKLTEKRKLFRLKGFVNGVLRNIMRQKETITYPDRENIFFSLSVQYSMPEWIVKKWISRYGEPLTEELLQTFLEDERSLTIRFQSGRETEGKKALEAEGILLKPGKLFPYAFQMQYASGLEQLTSFRNGDFFIQDESSMLPVEISGVKTGDVVIDLCAAPGGKTTHVADILQGTGEVISADLTAEKVALICENIERLRLNNVKPIKNDARIFRKEWEKKADIVIADLPCSGLGVIRKKCDIKYKTMETDIAALSELQKEILQMAVRYIKPGGRLIFSTCTITEEENEENVFWMKKNLPLRSVSIEERLPKALQGKTGEFGYIQVMPHETGTDGFFVAVFEKTEQGKEHENRRKNRP